VDLAGGAVLSMKAMQAGAGHDSSNNFEKQLARGDLSAAERASRTSGKETLVALCRLQEGRSDEAVQLLEEIVRRRPESFEDRQLLAIGCVKLGRIEDAAKHFGEAARLAPDDAVIQRQLQSLRRRAGERRKLSRSPQ
jgi:Flp pilus assembly protein TadD